MFAMKVAVIVNPVSGKGKSLGILPKVVAWCHKQGVEFRLFTTVKPGDGIGQARLAKLAGYERVVVLGGDGTINEVGQVLLGTNTVMGVLPGGSGNDFHKMLGKKMSLREAMKIAFLGEPHEVDVGIANGRPFFNVVGIGFDARVAYEAAHSRLSGFPAYLRAVFKVLRTHRPLPLDIELDQLKFSENVTLVSVGNGRASGGGFYLTPRAKLDDGLLDICIMKYFPKSKVFSVLPRALKGTHIRLDGVRVYRSRRVVVRSAEKFPVHIDGEPLTEHPDKLEIMLDLRKLKVAYGMTGSSSEGNA
jgi:diacylglycerol kinase (ATP)